jgi:hypothetical protein
MQGNKAIFLLPFCKTEKSIFRVKVETEDWKSVRNVSEERKSKWIEMLEREIADLRSDIENLTKSFQGIHQRETIITEKLNNVVKAFETHKDNEAFLIAFQAMGTSFSLDTELEEVREYARKRGKSLREAFDEMTLKNVLPRNLRSFSQTRKTIREML